MGMEKNLHFMFCLKIYQNGDILHFGKGFYLKCRVWIRVTYNVVPIIFDAENQSSAYTCCCTSKSSAKLRTLLCTFLTLN